jgi:AhpD family alkylhydroperoxidase
MNLEQRTLRLIAVGASITANCQPCLQTNIAKALEEGIKESEIGEAINVGKMVRRGAASKMDQFTANLNPLNLVNGESADNGCGCSS